MVQYQQLLLRMSLPCILVSCSLILFLQLYVISPPQVCNHPELFERQEIKSGFHIKQEPYRLPKLVYRDCLLDTSLPSRRHILYNKLCIYNTEHVHSSLFHSGEWVPSWPSIFVSPVLWELNALLNRLRTILLLIIWQVLDKKPVKCMLYIIKGTLLRSGRLTQSFSQVNG